MSTTVKQPHDFSSSSSSPMPFQQHTVAGIAAQYSWRKAKASHTTVHVTNVATAGSATAVGAANINANARSTVAVDDAAAEAASMGGYNADHTTATCKSASLISTQLKTMCSGLGIGASVSTSVMQAVDASHPQPTLPNTTTAIGTAAAAANRAAARSNALDMMDRTQMSTYSHSQTSAVSNYEEPVPPAAASAAHCKKRKSVSKPATGQHKRKREITSSDEEAEEGAEEVGESDDDECSGSSNDHDVIFQQ